MGAAALKGFAPQPAPSLCDLYQEHFEAAERVAGRRSLEIHVVCEVPLAAGERVLVMPWMLCERTTSGQFSLPRLSAPDVVAAASLNPSSLVELRREMAWFRLIDLLCGAALPRRETHAIIETFSSLHGLECVAPADLISHRANWLSRHGSLKGLLCPVIDRLNRSGAPRSNLAGVAHV